MSDNINFTTMTMEEYRRLERFEIFFGIAPTKFGQCLIGTHDKNICHLALFDAGKENSAIDLLQQNWPHAQLREDAAAVDELAASIFGDAGSRLKLRVLLRGTEMQCRVWMELTKLRQGTTCSYEQIAKAVGSRRAVRAVAAAIAKNQIAYVIPCHRVVRKTGALSKYRWGAERKRMILKFEGVSFPKLIDL